MIRAGGLAACLALSLNFVPSGVSAAPRVLSVDQCADQYVMALADRSQIVGVSRLAGGPDSYLRDRAAGLPMRRATLESVLAARPEVVVRAWTPDARLAPALEARGIAVAQLDDANDFDGVRRNIRKIAKALGQSSAGERLVADMDAKLARAKGAWGGKRALYLTPAGYTSGAGTMTDAMLKAAGLTNATTAPGFQAVPLEKLALNPPEAVVLAFFDAEHMSRWSAGRRPLVQRLIKDRTIASLTGAELLCSAWFSADASLRIANLAPRRP